MISYVLALHSSLILMKQSLISYKKQQQQHPFNGHLSGTTQMSRY